jgi:hypothetical protein
LIGFAVADDTLGFGIAVMVRLFLRFIFLLTA